jgi:hypothetical protein
MDDDAVQTSNSLFLFFFFFLELVNFQNKVDLVKLRKIGLDFFFLSF